MALLISFIAIAAFICTAAVLGALVLFLLVAFVMNPHGAGILPEWANLPVLALCAAGVGYVAFKVAMWTQKALARRFGAMKTDW